MKEDKTEEVDKEEEEEGEEEEQAVKIVGSGEGS